MTRIWLLLIAGALTAVAPACSPGDMDSATPPATTTIPRPPGPAATLAGPMTGGKGIARPTIDTGAELTDAGYVEEEYTASGTATSYRSVGALPADGTYTLEPDAAADYTTRIVVRRPADARAFSGTVALEWINVSGGIDAAPDYLYLGPELLRKGYAWVGVSAQRIGVEGGEVAVRVPGADEAGAGRGLRANDPERYGGLRHPGDAFASDIYTQVARALRASGGVAPLGNATAQRILAVGESQSAYMLTTYYDGVQPLTRMFDGFLIHSRGGGAAPISAPSGAIDMATVVTGTPTRLRTDQAAPAIVVETETDVLGILAYDAARQPDHDRLRVWEVAGTAHADRQVIGQREAVLGCPQPINAGQQYAVVRAALRHLDRWVTTGTPPPAGTPYEIDRSGAAPAFVTDAVGNVKGGVRTPAVDAPVDRLSGMPPPAASIVCLLSGTTTPLTAAQLATLYPSREDYLARYTRATDAAIGAGFALAEDRDELLRGADPSRISA